MLLLREIGSSPRGRGTQSDPNANFEDRRFIPARAGNTIRRDSPRSRYPVHPRAGGEHIGASGIPSSGSGSSPRGRGTHVLAPLGGRAQRFIPARAGNTNRSETDGDAQTVHPRAGGEHRQPYLVTSIVSGSSPRGRGTPVNCPSHAVMARFIPARAGNTRGTSAPQSTRTVHPRAGGEHIAMSSG